MIVGPSERELARRVRGLGPALLVDHHRLDGGDRPSDRVGPGEVVVARDRGGDRRRLREAVGGGERVPHLGERGLDPLDQLRRGGRAAVADPRDRAEVVVPEGLGLHDAPHHRGDTADRADLLALDRLHRVVGVEPSRRHEHELRTPGVGHDHRRAGPGHVEQRHDEQGRRLVLGALLAPPRRRAGLVGQREVHEVGERLAVGDRGALGLAGRARRVEDREDVVLVDGDVGERARVVGDEQLHPGTRHAVGLVEVHHEDVLEGGDVLDDVVDDHPPLRVAEEHLGPRVAEREVQLLGLPPRIQRHARGADARTRPEHHHPLDRVRGEHRDAVAALDAQLAQGDARLAGEGVVLAEREPAVALDEPVRSRPGRRRSRAGPAST